MYGAMACVWRCVGTVYGAMALVYGVQALGMCRVVYVCVRVYVDTLTW